MKGLMMKVGDKVKVVKSVDDGVPAMCVGEIGVVTKMGRGQSVKDMINVKFDDGFEDSYWPSELSVVENGGVGQ